MLLRQPLHHAAQLDVHNPFQLRLVEAVEDDDVVQAVEELRPEVLAQFRLHLVLHRLPGADGILPVQEVLLNDRRTDVGGHDDNGVLEIDRATLAIRQSPVVQHLQQHVEDIRMRLLDFVEEHHRIRPAPDRFAQLAAFLEAHVARRRPDQAGHCVLLHVLRHVDSHHRVLVVEQELGQRPSQLGFPDPGRTQKHEGTNRAVWILKSRAGAAHRVGDGMNGFLLTNHPFAQTELHLH